MIRKCFSGLWRGKKEWIRQQSKGTGWLGLEKWTQRQVETERGWWCWKGWLEEAYASGPYNLMYHLSTVIYLTSEGMLVLHNLLTNLLMKSGLLDMPGGVLHILSMFYLFSALACLAPMHRALSHCPWSFSKVLSVLWVFRQVLLSLWFALPHPTHSQPFYYPAGFPSFKSQVKCHFLGPSQLKYDPSFIHSTSHSILS